MLDNGSGARVMARRPREPVGVPARDTVFASLFIARYIWLGRVIPVGARQVFLLGPNSRYHFW